MATRVNKLDSEIPDDKQFEHSAYLWASNKIVQIHDGIRVNEKYAKMANAILTIIEEGDK